jgi:hypothetical protein
MARPTDWHVLDLSADPVPGDPWRVKDLGGRLRNLADDAENAARNVRGLVGDHAAMNWIGAAGDAFKEHIGKFPGQLDKVANSHHMCADALTAFANSLDGAQSQADRALVQARPLFDQVQSLHSQLATANANATSASKSYSTLTGGANAPDSTALAAAVRAKTDSQHTVDSLNSQLSGPEAQLEALKKLAHQAAGLRESAENTAERQIHAATDAGIPPDSFWHKLGDLAATLWHGLVIIAKIVSFIGAIVLLVVGGPLWLIVAVVVAGLIILADTLYKYSQGQASLWDVGLAVLGCIPITKGLTSLNAIREAFQAGGLLGAGLHIGGAFLSTAKDFATGAATLLRGGFGRLLAVFSDGSRAVDGLGAFRAGFTPWTEGGPVVSVNRLVRTLGQAGYGDLARMFDIQRVPVIRDLNDGFGWGYSPLGQFGADGKPIIQISHRGLSSMDEALKTFFHETYHWDTFFKMGVGGTEDAAEAFGVQKWQEVMDKIARMPQK